MLQRRSIVPSDGTRNPLGSADQLRYLNLEQRDLLLGLLQALPHRGALATIGNEADEVVEAPALPAQLLLLAPDQLGNIRGEPGDLLLELLEDVSESPEDRQDAPEGR